MRRLADEVPLQGQVPQDGERRRRHDRQGGNKVTARFRRTVHGPVIGYARVAGTRAVGRAVARRSSAGRETTDQIFFQRLTYGRVRSARRLHQRLGGHAADVQLVLRRRDETSRSSPPAGCRCARRASTATCRSTAAAGSSGRATCARASTRRTSTRRAGCWSTGTTSRPGTSRPATAAGTRAAPSASTGCWPRSTPRDGARRRERGGDRRPARAVWPAEACSPRAEPAGRRSSTGSRMERR